MGDVLLILSSKESLTPRELLEAVLLGGGHKDADGATGHIEDKNGQAHIWIHLDAGSIHIIQQENPEEFATIQSKLGHIPQSCIGVEIDSAPGGQTLAINFACTCAMLWPCVVDTLDEPFQVFSKEEILHI